jgi:predicted nucleic acid-binding protein
MTGIDHLLDSNIVSGLTLSRAGVSQISRMELLGFPAITPGEEQATRALLNLCQVIGISDEIEAQAIRLRRAGGLKLPDAIIAATALVTGGRLLTLDQRLAKAMLAPGGQP